MLFSVKDKVIVISGATGILGSAIASHLAREGAKVVILGRNKEKVDQLVKTLREENYQARGLLADVTHESQLLKAASQLAEAFPQIDVLINCAGGNMPGAVVTPDQNLSHADAEGLNEVMRLNYMGTFLPTKAFLPLFDREGEGSIINISSMAADRPLTRVLGYSSAKAAVDNLTKWLSVEFQHKYPGNLRVNAVAPGFFLTTQNKELLTHADGTLTDRGQQIISHTPAGRFGDPEDLLGVCQWLCSPASKFVTGTVIPIDGGFSAYSGV